MSFKETFQKQKWFWLAMIGLVFIYFINGKYNYGIIQLVGGLVVFWLVDFFAPHVKLAVNEPIYEQASAIITSFLEGRIGVRKWKSFLNTGMNGDYRFIAMQQCLIDIETAHPPKDKDIWCSDGGREVIKAVAGVIANPDWTLDDLATISAE